MLKIPPLPGEETLRIIRKMPTRSTKQIMAILLVFVASLFLFAFGQNQYLRLSAVLLLFIDTFFAFMIYLIWYNDVDIITNKRVILVNKTGLFSHRVSEVGIQDIAAVSYIQKGFIGAITSSGTVEILETSGHKTFLENVLNPQAAHETVQVVVNRTRQNT